uniref:Uncharacterized protein n=1 Tax=Anopheles atroparvus TaxID=41427 RepID=A0A182J850_ANOAO
MDPSSTSKVKMDSYEIIEKIGQGEFGTVFKARKRTNDSTVAVKRIKEEASSKEMMMQSMLQHLNLVSLLELEFFPMDLYDQLRRVPTGKMLEPELIKS